MTSSMLKPKYHFHHSSVLEAPPEVVWRELRDMISLFKGAFQGAVHDVYWVDGGSAERIPSRYEFVFQPGGERFSEEVIGRSELEHWISYRTVGSVMGLVDYVGRMSLRPITDEPNRCLFEATKDFRLAEGMDANAFIPSYAKMIEQQMVTLKAHFAGKR